MSLVQCLGAEEIVYEDYAVIKLTYPIDSLTDRSGMHIAQHSALVQIYRYRSSCSHWPFNHSLEASTYLFFLSHYVSMRSRTSGRCTVHYTTAQLNVYMHSLRSDLLNIVWLHIQTTLLKHQTTRRQLHAY